MTEKARKRHELITIVQIYTEALLEKKPDALPLADNVRATYNGYDIAVGDNEVWHNALVIRDRQTFVDPDTGEAVFFGMVSNETIDRNMDFAIANSTYVYNYHYTLRLKVVDGKITEIEELGADRRLRNFYSELSDIHFPDPEFEILIPEDEQSTKEELIDIVNAYWDASNHEGDWEHMPVHPDAQRIENGYRTTNHSRSFMGDFKYNPAFGVPAPESTRLFPVVDPARGVVVSFCLLESRPLTDFTREGARGIYIAEAFKIRDGAMSRLYAHFLPYDGPTGWER